MDPQARLITHIVQGIHYQPKPADPLQVIRAVLDIPVSRMNIYAGRRIEVPGGLSRNDCFRLRDVRFAEEKLAIEIREVYGVQIDLA